MTQMMVTAQRLVDGRVVYLRADRGWAERDRDGWASDDADQVEAELAWASVQTESVVGAYRIEVDVIDGAIRHRSARERIRAEGPAAVLQRFGPRHEPATHAAVG